MTVTQAPTPTPTLKTPVPDTGQTKCYDVVGNVITCPSPGQALYGQDANYSINPMSYTKLDGSGNALPDSATSWITVKDNVTGLIWEMKNGMDGNPDYSNPHDADNTYTWYDSNPATNGGNDGTYNNGINTESFIKALNDAHYGGYSDWRLPTFKELAYIVNYSIPYPGPTIDTRYFPNTQQSLYWQSTTDAGYTSAAWLVSFLYGDDHGTIKSSDSYARAVRGGYPGSFGAVDSGLMDDASTAAVSYTDNGDGTVTDISTGLMWQQASSSNSMTWEQALAYCEGLNLGGHTDWRLATIKELRSLVDYSIPSPGPTINTTFFSNTAASWYWSSTANAYRTNQAWLMYFYGGFNNYLGKDYDGYARAVRAGQSGPFGNLVISPTNQAVSKDAASTTFSVSNTGSGTMPWTAAVTSGDSWFAITSGASGTDIGTINCSFTANTSTSARTATIKVTATGATGSPVDVTVTQTSSVCTATLDGKLSLHIPYLFHVHPMLGNMTLWANFVYDFDPTLILYKLTNYDSVNNSSNLCSTSTLSNDLKIHLPDVLLPDGNTHLWVDLEYSLALSTNGDDYWVVTNYGVLSN